MCKVELSYDGGGKTRRKEEGVSDGKDEEDKRGKWPWAEREL